MSKENMKYKDTVMEIKRRALLDLSLTKTAQDIEPPGPPPGTATNKPAAAPQGEAPGAAPNAPPKAKPVQYVNPSYSSVKQMQDAIKRFVDAAVRYRRVPNTTQISQDDTRKDFNDFLAEQYSANSSVHGEEWTTEATATNKEQKQPTEIIELNNVLDQLYRTGPGKSERMTDGIWDFRTNNAVKNICAVADALVRVTEDFGGTIPNKSFTRADLNKLMGAVPKVKDPRKANPADLKLKADIITAQVDKLTDFYKGYHKYVVDHPAYKDYINVKKPLFSAKPGGEDPAAMPKELQQYDNQHDKMYITVNLPAKSGPLNNAQVKLSDLKDEDSLQRYMSNVLGYDNNEINNPELVRKVFDSIYAQVTNAVSVASKLPGVMEPVPTTTTTPAPAAPAAPVAPAPPQPPKV